MEITNLLEKALNVRAAYHRVIAGNIANVETPGYKEKDVDFQKALERTLSSERGIDSIEIMEKSNSEGAMDNNSVNMENQIMKLTENTMMFNSFVQLINKRFSMLRYVIREGK